MRVLTACNRDCPDACGMIATVEDGRVVRLEGDPGHPVTRGFLCYRTSRFLERQYDPERLTAPLLRHGSGFEAVSWDDALDLVAEKMLRIKSESGGASILHYRSGGSLGILKQLTGWFFERFGPVTVTTGSVCSGAGEWAQRQDLGVSDSNDLLDLLNSRTIVLWGKNPHVSSVHLLPILREARQRGSRLVLVDPIRHRGADLCDVYVQPRPGGDVALGLGVARRLFERFGVDPGAGSYCDHLDAFRDLAFSRGEGAWAELAGVAGEDLAALSDAYAAGPSAILVGWGMQRRSNGAAAVRVLDALGAISGNLGVPGGGVSFYFRRRGAFDLSFMGGKDAAPRGIPEPLLGPGILEASDPAVRMVWITAGNPVAMLPESRTTARALTTRELTVVVDAFLTDTARAAHLVLPTTTMLEDDDLLGSYGHHWIAEVRPAVPPPDGVLTDYEIVRRLAARVGLAGDFLDDAETWKRRLLAPVAGRGASLENLRQGAVRNPMAPRVLFEDRAFATPSGRVNLVHAIAPEPPVPPADRPLFLMAISTEKAQCSQWPSRTQEGPLPATVHPDAAPGFLDGDAASLESELGSLDVRLVFDTRQRRDVVLVPKGGWLHRGRCANVLTPACLTDAGEGAVYYETPVRIVPASRS